MDSVAKLADGHLDLIMTPEQFLSPDHPRKLLFNEDYVVIGWNQNPVFGRQLTEETFFSCPYVAVEISGTRSFIEAAMLERGDRRQIDCVVPSFGLVPWLLPETNLLALMHKRLADIFTVNMPLATAPVPFEIPVMREMVQYHRARENDAGLHWLIERFTRFATQTQTGALDTSDKII